MPAVSCEEAPAVWDRGRWNVACCPAPPGPQGPLKASVQLSWPARQAGITGMTQPQRSLTSSTQRGPRFSAGAQGPAGLQAQRLPEAPRQGCRAQAATSARRTSCPPSGHPAPGAADLLPVSQGSAPQWAGAGRGAGSARELGAGKGYCRPVLPLSRLGPSPSSCLGLQLPPGPALLLPCSVQLRFRFRVLGGGVQWHSPPEGLVWPLAPGLCLPGCASDSRLGEKRLLCSLNPLPSSRARGLQGLGRQPWPWVRRLAHYPQLHCQPQLALLPAPSTRQDCQGAQRRRARFRNRRLGLRQNHRMQRTYLYGEGKREIAGSLKDFPWATGFRK